MTVYSILLVQSSLVAVFCPKHRQSFCETFEPLCILWPKNADQCPAYNPPGAKGARKTQRLLDHKFSKFLSFVDGPSAVFTHLYFVIKTAVQHGK